jgi:hypothetical protein
MVLSFNLLINNSILPNFTLPSRTDVRNFQNHLYVDSDEPMPHQAPTYIPDNVAAGGGENIVAPAHTIFS